MTNLEMTGNAINLQWKKDLFSSLFSIYSNNQQIGILKNNGFSQNAKGKLNGKEYFFDTSGFFEPRTKIIDPLENKVIGEITYNSWMTKATITFDKKRVQWKYDNAWNTKWSVFNSDGINVRYSGSSTSGVINSNIDDPLIVLSGLFVINYYWQMLFVVLIIIFIPILIT